MSEKKVISKSDWVSNFMLIGKPVINDFTFKLNERSERSNWIYNAMNLRVDCGEKCGVIDAKMMGGYSEDVENRIFAYSKRDDKNGDSGKQVIVDWSDRFNDRVLEEIGSSSFIEIGLEKTDKGDIFVKKFLSAYDAIAYVKEHLREDMVVNVRGKITYSLYNDAVQVNKEITSIKISEVDDSSKYAARFTQTVLIDKDSASLKNIDKDKGVMYVDARVLDYLKEYKGVEVKGQFPYNKQFEYAMDFSKEDVCKKIMERLFKVKKGVTQITFDGEFIESGATTVPTLDDIPDNIKSLIGSVFTEEEALVACAVNGKKQKRMVLKAPHIKKVGDDDKKIPVLQKFEERYEEEDLVLDYLYETKKSDVKAKDDKPPFDIEEEVTEDDSMSWLNDMNIDI